MKQNVFSHRGSVTSGYQIGCLYNKNTFAVDFMSRVYIAGVFGWAAWSW